jgi:DNA-binding GntR family transcriptional regulator
MRTRVPADCLREGSRLTEPAALFTVAEMKGRVGDPPQVSVLPLQRETGAVTLADRLREELLSGAAPPGTALNEPELARRVGAAVSDVRAALADLAREGLVVHSLHHGVEVKRIGPEDVRDIYAVRLVYEKAGLEALLSHRPIDLSWLRAAADRMGEAAVARDWRAAVEADMAFHLAIVAAAGVPRLTNAARNALSELRVVLAVADRAADDLPALVSDHDHLVSIFATGREPWAAAALEDHLLRGETAATLALSL